MQVAQPIVRGFTGENRLLSDDELTDAMAVDGLNVDYGRRTIRKRLGRRRLNLAAMLEGGVHIANSASAKCVHIPAHNDYAFSGDFTIEFVFKFLTLYGSTDRVLATCRNTATGKGWYASVNTSNAVSFIYYDNIGTARTVTVAAPNGIISERPYHYAARRTGNDITVTITEMIGGASAESSAATANGAGTPDRPIYLGAADGATPGSATVDVVIDEFRMWSAYRSDTELESARVRELIEDEVADGDLVGYWPMSDSRWNTVTDRSLRANHGTFYSGGPSFERSIVPYDSSEGFAARFDGVDDYGTAPYHADYAPILDTSNQWTLEAWVRLDNDIEEWIDVAYEGVLLQLGDYTGGATITWLTNNGVARRLILRFSTTTTHTNTAVDPSVQLPVGVPFHLATVRDADTITVFLNGQVVYTNTGYGTENGKANGTTYGMTFAAKNSAGVYSNYAPITLDEVRLWKKALSHNQIQTGLRRPLAGVLDADLIGHWRFDRSDKEHDETGRADITFTADGTRPEWGQGLVYPVDPPRMLLVAPLVESQTGNETLAGDAQIGREFLIAVASGFYSFIGGKSKWLRSMYVPGEPTLFDWCHFQNKLIAVNGIEANQKYDGADVPRGLSLEAPGASPGVAVGAAGLLTGTFQYRVAFRNTRDGTESLASVASATVSPSSQKVELTAIPVSDDPQVDQRRIYRLDNGATVYRYLADVDDNTTTTYSDNTADGLATTPVSDAKGFAPKARHCAVYGNRLWIANLETNPSGLMYSEADQEYAFPATNLYTVDRGDGDEITGIKAVFGGLVIWKQRSIHFLIGEGPTTYDLKRVQIGPGCVSGNTIQITKSGVYFVGLGDAYVMTDITTVQPIATSQQPLFRAMDSERFRSAVGTHSEIEHKYVTAFGIAETQQGRYYDFRPDLFTNYWRLAADGDDEAAVNDLTESGAPVYVTDTARGAVAVLDGSSDYYSGAYASYPEAFTFGLWYQPASLSATAKVIAELVDGAAGYKFYLEHAANGALWGAAKNATSANLVKSVPFTLEVGAWHHIVLVKVGSATKLFVNGAIVAWGTAATGGGSNSGTGALSIGQGPIVAGKADGRYSNAWLCSLALTDTQVREVWAYESTGYKNRRRLTLAYDEVAGGWAKWDGEADALLSATWSANRVETFGGEKGFIHRLFDGYSNGSDYVDGYEITRSGSLTANASNTVSDAGYTFFAGFSGLAGAPIVMVNAADGAIQRRIIVGNTATALYWDRPLQPAVTGTWYLAPIEFAWESRWMDFDAPAWVKRLYWFHLWMKEDATSTVTVKYKTDYDETWKTISVAMTDEFAKDSAPGRGRKIKVRFEALNSSYEEIELTAWQFIATLKRAV